MSIKIRKISEKDYEIAYKFQVEYLDDDSYDQFLDRVKNNPDLYLVAYDKENLVGICYGHPSKKDPGNIVLQGVAVNLDSHARKGIGSTILKEFERIVVDKGYKEISLGSAEDDKVEKFYLKNGYAVMEIAAKDLDGNTLARMSVKDYKSGNILREELREKFNPKEVIFFFSKKLN